MCVRFKTGRCASNLRHCAADPVSPPGAERFLWENRCDLRRDRGPSGKLIKNRHAYARRADFPRKRGKFTRSCIGRRRVPNYIPSAQRRKSPGRLRSLHQLNIIARFSVGLANRIFPTLTIGFYECSGFDVPSPTQCQSARAFGDFAARSE